MRPALLFQADRDPAGKMQLRKLVANVSIPVPFAPDVLVYRGQIYVFHYEGAGEVYYRQADVYHYQKNAVMVDGMEIAKEEEHALLRDHGRRGKT